jgi:hypothetical protein
VPDSGDGDQPHGLDDGDWLRAQIDADRDVADIAAEVGRTPRAVRYALHRHQIDTPRVRRVRNVSDADVRDDYRAGVPLTEIAERYRLGIGQVKYRTAGLKRAKPRRQNTSGYAELNDPAWLRVELALGATRYSIAKQLGCDRTAVPAAMRRHGVTAPPTGLSQLERVQALTNPAERAGAAARVEAEARAVASEATRIKVAALRAARRGERPVTA